MPTTYSASTVELAVSTSETVRMTVPAGTTRQILAMVATNADTATDHEVQVLVKTSGGTVKSRVPWVAVPAATGSSTAGSLILRDASLPIYLTTGDTISTEGSNATGLAVEVTYSDEVTS